MATDNPASDLGARNFLKVLGLIDRTVLPRRLLLSNGISGLALIAARGCALLDGRDARSAGASLPDLSAAIKRLCSGGRPVTYRVEPVATALSAPAGHSAVAIVNAQESLGTVGEEEGYRFAPGGWPLAVPAKASFAALDAAARIAEAMARWEGLDADGPALILAVGDGAPAPLSVSLQGGLTITTTPPAHLGQIISRWRSRSPAG
jgi:hypothetical protein